MVLNYKQIAEDARAFYNVGRLRVDEPSKWSIGYSSVPFWVNTAFACELYMKSIICYYNPGTTVEDLRKISHYLDRLFEKLPEGVKREIREQIPDLEIQNREQRKNIGYRELLSSDAPDDIKSIVKYELENAVSTFDEALKKQANLFKDWRYLYEASAEKPASCDEWFLYTFCNSLHNILVKIMTKE